MPPSGGATNTTTWIVVANEATALIYARERKRGPLERIGAVHNEAARSKAAEFASDREGRSFDSHGQGRHAMTREKSDPRRRASETFAKDIAARVQKALQTGQCADFALIAAPRFLGMLRKELARPGLPEPILALDKDVVDQDVEALRKLLA